MIELLIEKQKIKIVSSIMLVSGTTGYKVHFIFSPEWDQFRKTAVFRSLENTNDYDYPVIIDNDNYCNIPADILIAGSKLQIGVYGVSSDNTLPTIWSNPFLVKEGAIPSGELPPEQESAYQQILQKTIRLEECIGNIEDLKTENKENLVKAINELYEKPYLSIERKCAYLYKVTYKTIQEPIIEDSYIPAGCSTFLQNGRMYRNLDWYYSELASFHVKCSGFEGMAFSPGLTNDIIPDSLLGQLPYRIVDGCNDYGIRVSTHVLYNDWKWVGHGNTPLYMIPYLILNRVHSLDNFFEKISSILEDLYATSSLTESDYLLHFFVTDGTSAYAIEPPESAYGNYQVIDITSNPKLSNFRWVNSTVVTRNQLQRRPTGVERWNLMPCSLDELRFTKAYEAPDRLSEFIGIRGTTKDSTDIELSAIYNDAHDEYQHRMRDGKTWQTMHSVVYSNIGLESLYVQENWERDMSK